VRVTYLAKMAILITDHVELFAANGMHKRTKQKIVVRFGDGEPTPYLV